MQCNVFQEGTGENMPPRTINRALPLFAGLLLSIAASRGASLQADLTRQFPITQVANDGSVVTAGTVLVLQKDGFLTYGINAPLPALNTWKNGKISAGVGRALTVGMAMKNQGATDLPMRKFVTGESLWVIGIAVQKDAMIFRLLSDPINGFRYFGDLKFPFPKGSPPPLDEAVVEINEVLTVQQPAKPATEAAPAPAVSAPAPVPAPAPPVESQTVNLGDTPERVAAALGQPKNIVNLGTRQIYVYANLKITFENGKVTDVQ
jgi:hypothetical protein